MSVRGLLFCAIIPLWFVHIADSKLAVSLTTDSEDEGLDDAKDPEIHWINQTLDHFKPADGRTWKQKYIINDQFYKFGGPVFLVLGGEGPVSPNDIKHGQAFVTVLAMKFNALLLTLEHRYYGESKPFVNASDADLSYLTSQQALADAAFFRIWMVDTKRVTSDAKWVMFGCSYPGSLAAWFKLKYPHLASGAVASSAPLRAVVDYHEYFKVVAKSFSSECRSNLNTTFATLQELSLTNGQNISSILTTCETLDVDDDNVLGTLLRGIFWLGQNNLEGIENICEVISVRNRPALEKLSTIISVLRDGWGCTNGDASDNRMWVYQTCFEFGFFQSIDFSDTLFGSYFTHLGNQTTEECHTEFPELFSEDLLSRAIKRTNMEYGAQNPQVNNVTFVNGSQDPWHPLSVLEDISDDVTAIIIQGAGHCQDVAAPDDKDSDELKQARKKIEEKVAKFLL